MVRGHLLGVPGNQVSAGNRNGGGIFRSTALSGIWFGSLVDHYRKKAVMQASSLVSLAFYAVAFTLYQLTSEQTFANPASVMLWVFIVLSMFGVIAG